MIRYNTKAVMDQFCFILFLSLQFVIHLQIQQPSPPLSPIFTLLHPICRLPPPLLSPQRLGLNMLLTVKATSLPVVSASSNSLKGKHKCQQLGNRYK